MTQLLTDQLRLMAEHFPGETGYKNLGDGTSLTFLEWEQESNRLARGLVARGVAKGDRVALLVPVDEPLRWIVAYAAIHKAGAVAVPVNTRMVERELEYVLGHAEVVATISGADVPPKVPTLRFHATTDEWESFLDRDGSAFQVPVERGDLADVMYTSGTTGRPKGVVVRHRNIAMIPNVVPNWTGQVWMHASPLFTFAGIAFVYNPMKMGLTGAYLPRFDAGRFLELVEQERPVMLFIVPAMAQLLLAHERFASTDFSSIVMCSIGSAPIAPDTLRRLQTVMPNANVSNSYGMTEAGPAFCSMPPGEAEKRPGSVGQPLPPTEFRIVDESGGDVAPREVGEVLIRNPGREREYYNDPEATAATWTADGWLRSGDLGFLDEDGYLYIVGRKKDVIIRGGNNVHAKDVEDALYEHPAVQEAAVAGIPHDVLGEDVAAWIVLRAGAAATGEELIEHCRARLADYKVPRRITFVDELPRNATGKVLKRDLVGLA